MSLRSNLSNKFDVLFMFRALPFATTFNLSVSDTGLKKLKGARVIRCDLVDEIVELWLLSGNGVLKPLICELQVTLLSRFMNSTNAGLHKDRGVGLYVFLLLILVFLTKESDALW